MQVFHLIAPQADRKASREATRLCEDYERYEGRIERVESRRDLSKLGGRIPSAMVHLWGDSVRLLPHVLKQEPAAVVCDTRGAALPRKIAERRWDPDRVRFVGSDSSQGKERSASQFESLYDELLADGGMPPPRDSLSATAPPARGSQLRVVFVTQEDPFYLPCFFDEFYRIADQRRRLANSHGATVELAGIMIQRPLGNRTKRGLLKRMWRLYGSVGLARQVLRYAYRRVAPWRHGVAEQATRSGVPVLGLKNANGTKFVSFVDQNEIDVVVSVSAAQIFKTQILHAPRLGCINLHNAPLPRYRGMLPNFWQMYHDEPYSVLTIHSMVEDLDKGNVLLQRSTPIEDGMSLERLIRRTKTRSARALWNVLDGFALGTLSPEGLPTEGGSYFSWPTRAEAREFRRRGKRLL